MSGFHRSERSPAGSARWVATVVLHRVSVDAAFAARTLDVEIESAQLSERDARLATEIVYGTLRQLPIIDARLDPLLERGRPDPFTFSALRAAAYQTLFLTRVPDFAIVQETVSIVKFKRGQGLGKLANAVLRKLVAARPKEPLSSTHLALPDWVQALLVEGIGQERTTSFENGADQIPPLALRLSSSVEREAVLRALQEARPQAEVADSQLHPRLLLARHIGDPRRLPGYADGHFAVQDAGATLVGALCGARPGERVLDACAGRGGKTLQLLEAVGSTGQVTAVDIYARKLEQLVAEAERLALPTSQLATETVDLSQGDGGLTGGFDRILVDAPCTGLGTLRRRPEILLRLSPKDPARMAELQTRILRTALKLLRPGGTLVFAVCSSSRAEALGVAETLEARDSRIRRLRQPLSDVPVNPDEDGVFRIGPWLGGAGELPDVYQVVRWEMLDSHRVPV